MTTDDHDYEEEKLPLLAIRTDVLLPGVVLSLEIGRTQSLAAVDAASSGNGRLFVVPQRDPSVSDPTRGDLVEVGVIAEVVQLVKRDRTHFTAILRGLERAMIEALTPGAPHPTVRVVPFATIMPADTGAMDALVAQTRADLTAVVRKENDPDQLEAIGDVDDADELVNLASTHIELDREAQLRLLTEPDPEARLRIVAEPLTHLRQVLDLREDIRDEIEGDMSRTARERLLRERLRSIKSELGEGDGDSAVDEYLDKVAESGMSDEARRTARRELGRMRLMDPSSPQYNIGRTYVEWLLDIPWGVITDDTFDVPAARAILEAEHAGLAKVKRRILEFIAVRKLAPDKSGAILCLVGPPGVGKTSLGRSIATALGRKYVRVALGGVRDESAVRGHRRTYIGALPGRFITSLKKAGSMNPVFVLDEIDKLGSDHRGDPTSALLEVLDPEQNHEFQDHYVDIPVDLSKVMFIATANQLETIPAALLDRLEVIHVPGYTEREKLEIGRKHLLPKQLAEHGIGRDQVEIPEEIITSIILHHTREAGVRNLERELASVCRAAAVQVAGGKKSVIIGPEELEEILGPPRFISEVADRSPAVGVATGLAWTPVGGTILFIEARAMPGTGRLKLTGQVGDVMSESMTAAMSYVRSRAESLGIDNARFEDTDVHIHLPSGGIKKDGPSAGVAVTTTLVSLLTNRPIRADVAITGEVTLRGLVLPVGGIKEKVLAAHRAGIKTVVMPLRNEKDLVDVPDEVKDELTIKLVSRVAEAMEIALAADEGTDEPTSPIPPPTASNGDSTGETFAE